MADARAVRPYFAFDIQYFMCVIVFYGNYSFVYWIMWNSRSAFRIPSLSTDVVMWSA